MMQATTEVSEAAAAQHAMSPSDHQPVDDSQIPENVLQLLSVSKILLLQGADVVDKHLISDEQLATSSRYLPGSTIGVY